MLTTARKMSRSSVARRLILYVVLFSSFITLLITVFQLYRDYDNDIGLIESQLQQVQNVHLKSLTATLWASDAKELRTHLEGISRLRDMQFLEIRDKDRVWVSLGIPQSTNVMSRRYPMVYRHRDRDIEIGTLTVVASLDGVYQRLIDKAWMILASNAIKTFLVAGFILLIFYTLISRHLTRIAEFTGDLDIHRLDKPLKLDRPARRSDRRDELDLVTDAINRMQDTLRESLTALQHSEQRQRMLARVSPVGIFRSDAQGNCVFTNERWRELAGLTEEQALGQGWSRALHPDDRERVFEEWCRAAESKTPFHSEYRFLHPDGRVSWLMGAAQPELDARGDVVGYVGTVTDITDRKQAEEALRESERRLNYAQRMAHIGNWELDLINDKLWWSDEVYHIFGVEPGRFEITYQAFLSAIHPDDREWVEAAYAESVENKTPYNIEHRLKMPDGTIKHVQERCETFYDDDGKPLRSVGTVQDITSRVVMEEALRRSQKMDAIGQLSGGIAHDFNNQLGVVVGYLDFLKDYAASDEKARRWVDTATKATLRCMDLTRQLLACSRERISTDRVLNINDSLRDLEDMIARSVTPEVEVQYFLIDDLWPVNIDPGEFQDAILNLVINARDAMPNGGKLLIETSNKRLGTGYTASNPDVSPGNYVQLMLSDTGTGMDRDTLEHIFDPFFTTKPEGQGTGLGMAMVYGFAKRHGGNVKVYSEQGVGTTVRLYLPRADEPSEQAADDPGRTDELPTGHERILIVDDETDLLTLAEQYLNDLGYHTRTAENAHQALDRLASGEHFDLLFSDVVMPGGINGYELAHQATQEHPELKVLLTSGFTSKTIAHNGLVRFSTHLLDKPYRKADLAQRIRLVLDEDSTFANQQQRARDMENPLDNRTILVVDDEPEVQELFRLNLERLGCNTLSASDGREAVARYRQAQADGKPIDAVILDLNLPGGMDGREIAAELRAMDPRTKLIVASGHSESPEMTRCEDYGFDAALEKNFNRQRIRQVLEQLLSGLRPGQ